MPPEKDESLRDVIVSAFKESSEKAGSTSETSKPQDAATTAEPTQTSEPPKQTTAPQNKTQKADDKSAAAPAGTGSDKDDKSGTGKTPADPKDDKSKSGKDGKADDLPDNRSIDPPARWTKQEKEEWAKLDALRQQHPELAEHVAHVQRILSTRNKSLEADYTKKMMELAGERNRYQALEKLFAPRRQFWAANGTNEIQVLEQLLAYADIANRDPLEFIGLFARQRGLDLARLFAPQGTAPQHAQVTAPAAQPNGSDPAASQSAQAVHPDVLAHLEEMGRRQGLLEQFAMRQINAEREREAAQAQAWQSAAAQEYEAFVNAQDEHGNLKYPFFNDVRQTMAQLMAAGTAATLEDAYDKAVFLLPDTRQKLLESQEIARRRKEEADRIAEAERAKRAGASVTASSAPLHVPPAETGTLTLRQELERAFAAQRSGQRF
jgi:hypothetical protein